jgi:hypothetical protein
MVGGFGAIFTLLDEWRRIAQSSQFKFWLINSPKKRIRKTRLLAATEWGIGVPK